jgi:hypothetical protein
MCNFLHHLSCHCIGLNLIFPAFTLSPTCSNFRSSLHQMEPMLCPGRNTYLQKNQEPHLKRALAFKKAANLHCPSNVCLPIICLGESYCGWLISPISFRNQEDETNQEIGHGDSEYSVESTPTNHLSLTLHHPHGQWCFPTSLVETRILYNPRPVAIRTFPNTKRPSLR